MVGGCAFPSQFSVLRSQGPGASGLEKPVNHGALLWVTQGHGGQQRHEAPTPIPFQKHGTSLGNLVQIKLGFPVPTKSPLPRPRVCHPETKPAFPREATPAAPGSGSLSLRCGRMNPGLMIRTQVWWRVYLAESGELAVPSMAHYRGMGSDQTEQRYRMGPGHPPATQPCEGSWIPSPQ